MITAPAASSRCTTVASYGGMKPRRIFEDGGGGHAGRAHVVFEGDRHAVQRSERAAFVARGIERPRAIERAFGDHRDEGADRRLTGLDAIEARFDGGDGVWRVIDSRVFRACRRVIRSLGAL